MLQGTKYYKVLILISNQCYKLLNFTNYLMLQGSQCYEVLNVTN